MENAVEISALNVSYGKTSALCDVSLTVAEGEYLGIMGPNGSGKSTLLRAMLGLISPQSGEIKIFGKHLCDNKKTIGYVPQYSSLDRNFPISVGEVIMTAKLRSGLHPFFRFTKEKLENTEKILSSVGLDGYSKRKLSELSGGEMQRLLIARALAAEPSILLLDEPTASVDVKSREKIYALLGRLCGKITIVMVTHDMTAISSEVQKLACLNGRLVYHGDPKLTQSVVNELYGCPVDLIAHGLPHRVLKNHDGGDECC